MIEFVIAFINTRLEALNFFGEVKGLAELLQKEETVDGTPVTKIFPAIYCKGGDYKDVDDLSTYEEGLCYHRILSQSTEDGETEAVTACDKPLRQVTNMRLVALVPKKIFEDKNDNEFIDQKVLQNIKNAIFASNEDSIANTLKVDIVQIQVISNDTDRYAVFGEEFDEVRFNIGLEFILLSVDYDVAIEASQACFQNFDCDGLTPPVFCESTVIDANNPASPITLVNQETYTCLPSGGPTPSGHLYIRPALTGQKTSFRPRDDGNRNATGGYDFSGDPINPLTISQLDPANRLLLLNNNSFGNLNVWTNDLGGSVFDGSDGSTVNYSVNNYTGYGWSIIRKVGTWNVAIDDNTFATFTDMFVPNTNEMADIIDWFNATAMFNFAPFSNTGNHNLWTGTTAAFATTFVFSYRNVSYTVSFFNKGDSRDYYRTRKHF